DSPNPFSYKSYPDPATLKSQVPRTTLRSAVELSCDLLCLIHEAFKKRSWSVSVETSGPICSGAAKVARALAADRRKLSRKVVPGMVP
ncbi:hypothetical protein KUCAC02_008557, partial [Chaenocephalus aceratus]